MWTVAPATGRLVRASITCPETLASLAGPCAGTVADHATAAPAATTSAQLLCRHDREEGERASVRTTLARGTAVAMIFMGVTILLTRGYRTATIVDAELEAQDAQGIRFKNDLASPQRCGAEHQNHEELR